MSQFSAALLKFATLAVWLWLVSSEAESPKPRCDRTKFGIARFPASSIRV
jgi:hypothetical protein